MIEATLQQVNDSFTESPYDINDGLCEDWANQVFDRLKDEVFVEIWETLFGFAATTHVFIRIDGKFRDAECLAGVEDHMDLPIFAKLLAECGRQPVWLIDHSGNGEVTDNRRDVTSEMVRQYNEMNGTTNPV